MQITKSPLLGPIVRTPRYQYVDCGVNVCILGRGYNKFELLPKDEFLREFLAPFGFIYLLENIYNSKHYVGQTTRDVFVRYMEHVYEARNNPHSCMPIHAALKDFGEAHFELAILGTCISQEDLNIKEAFWISKFRADNPALGYNVTAGGQSGPGVAGVNNPNFGNHVLKGRKRPEHSAWMKANNPFRGKSHSAETKAMITAKNRLRKATEEQKLKISRASKLHWQDPVYREKVTTAVNKALQRREFAQPCTQSTS